MNAATRERLFGYQHAFDHAVTLWITVTLVVLLIATPVLFVLLQASGKVKPGNQRELWQRYLSWCVLVPLMIAPVLAGAAWTIIAVGILGIFSVREFAGVVGLRNEPRVVYCVYTGVVMLALATLDNWYAFFVALLPLTAVTIAAVAILDDRPAGYIQRVALGVWGFLLFGSALGHLGYFANDPEYRPMVILILLSVELNDIFAFCCGKLFGQRKIAPHTSPNKTLAGSAGAMILTTLLVMGLGHFVFAGGPLAQPHHLIVIGLIISTLGQLGDLMLSSVKRDIGVKDMGHLIPGHGGLLDRFDSLLLVAPAVFHYVQYVRGIGMHEATRILF